MRSTKSWELGIATVLSFVLTVAVPIVARATTVVNCVVSVPCDGTSGDDDIYGTTSGDDIDAMSGSDLIYGYAGAEDVHGSDGYDDDHGGNGNDTLRGGMNGEYDWDNTWGGAGADDLDDSVAPNANVVEFDLICGGDGNDRIDLRDANGRFVVEADEFVGGGGADTIISDMGVDKSVSQFNCDDAQ
ncbi:MAG: hypothetical protein QOE83_938 [Actinomycetota bacterium]|nr:hypothetical protein [Actinomycetota bacterium]